MKHLKHWPGVLVAAAGVGLAILVIVLAVYSFGAKLSEVSVPPPPLPPLTELPAGRGLDWSLAGYKDGREPIPSPPATLNVVDDFGAAGDGVTDDTAALQAALAAAHESAEGGVVLLPAGTYLLTQQLSINRSNIIIRGEGANTTELYIPLSLSDVYNGTWNMDESGKVTSAWLYRGGFLSINGRRCRSTPRSTLLATVDGSVQQGAMKIPVDSPSKFRLGQWVRIFINDNSTAPGGEEEDEEESETSGGDGPQQGTAPKGSITAFVYGDGLADSGQPGTLSRDDISFTAKIASIGDDWVALDRELPFPVKRRWTGVLHECRPTVQDSGIEHLTIRFKHTPAGPHLTERGYNAVDLEYGVNVWVRSLTILNADNGIKMRGIDRSTISDLTINVTARRWVEGASKKVNGHHGVAMSRSHSTLLTRLSLATPLYHGISMEGGALLNVASRSGGTDLVLDLHRSGPWGNLFTALDMGPSGKRSFDAGGRGDRGAHGGRQNTFWNLFAGDGSVPDVSALSPSPAPAPALAPAPAPGLQPLPAGAGAVQTARRRFGGHASSSGGSSYLSGRARARLRRVLAKKSEAESLQQPSSLQLPDCNFGPLLNFVGGFVGQRCNASDWLVAGLPEGKPDLHTSQVETRRRGG